MPMPMRRMKKPNPAMKPRRVLKKMDITYEKACNQIKEKVAHLYRDFGRDPLNKKIYNELKKNVEDCITAFAPYDPALYALLEAQWLKLLDDYKNFLSNPKKREFSVYLSDAFLVFKTEVENV